jgi:hypothetical protein
VTLEAHLTGNGGSAEMLCVLQYKRPYDLAFNNTAPNVKRKAALKMRLRGRERIMKRQDA